MLKIEQFKEKALKLHDATRIFTEHDSPHMPFCVYIKKGETLENEALIYLSDYPEISDDDTEVYPDFVYKNELEILCHGDQFEDIVKNVSSQLTTPTIYDHIKAINYYLQYDNFYDFH
jgi:hypothetical protein